MDVVESALSVMQALGPSLVLLISVVLVLQSLRKMFPLGQVDSHAERYLQGSTVSIAGREFGRSLEDALALNAFDVSSPGDPTVNLQVVTTVRADEYQKSAQMILRRYLMGEVVSVDLRRMNVQDAPRLVDFLSGVVAAKSGWIFRVADDVIILNPAERR